MNNLYKVVDDNGVSLNVWNKNSREVREDFECARPNDKIYRIIRLL